MRVLQEVVQFLHKPGELDRILLICDLLAQPINDGLLLVGGARSSNTDVKYNFKESPLVAAESFLRRRWDCFLIGQEEAVAFGSGHLSAEDLLESLDDLLMGHHCHLLIN